MFSLIYLGAFFRSILQKTVKTYKSILGLYKGFAIENISKLKFVNHIKPVIIPKVLCEGFILSLANTNVKLQTNFGSPCPAKLRLCNRVKSKVA